VPGGNSLPYIMRLWPSRHPIELGAIKPSIARSILQLDVQLIALGRTAWSVIKKLVQQAQQVHFAVNFDWAASEVLALQKFPKVFLSQSRCLLRNMSSA